MEHAVTIGSIALILILIGMFFGAPYRQLLEQRQSLENLWTRLDTALARRRELIPHLVSYLADESPDPGALRTRLNNAVLAAASPDARARCERSLAEQKLGIEIGQAFKVLEEQDRLSTRESYLNLRKQFLDSEDDLTLALESYNNMAKTYNAQQHIFPASLFAGKHSFLPVEAFEMEGAFDRYTLKFKPTRPAPIKRLLLMEPGSEKSQKFILEAERSTPSTDDKPSLQKE